MSTDQRTGTQPRHSRPYSAVQEQTIPFLRRTRRHADRPCEHPSRNSADVCRFCGDGALPVGGKS